MKIGPLGLWMFATVIVGGAFVFAQISSVSNVSLSETVEAAPILNKQTEEVSPVQNKWSLEELEKIKKNPPFNLVLPSSSILSKSQLTGAYESKVKGTSDKQVDIYYKTPKGDVHIWETNTQEIENDTFKSYETLYVGSQEWNYIKDLNILYSSINGLQVQISGQVPKEQLLNIIKSLNANN